MEISPLFTINALTLPFDALLICASAQLCRQNNQIGKPNLIQVYSEVNASGFNGPAHQVFRSGFYSMLSFLQFKFTIQHGDAS